MLKNKLNKFFNYNKKTVFLLVFVFCLIFISVAYLFVSADEVTFAGGDGTSGDPYQIEDCSQLQLVASTTYLSAYFILNNDIDCATTTSWNGGLGFSPIGDATNNFNGNFNGNGKKITDLYINRTSVSDRYIGLFGYTGSDAVISKVGLVDAVVRGYRDVGGLIGYNNGTTTESFVIIDLYALYASSANYAGGFVGYNIGNISNSYARGIIDSASSVRLGGFAGYHHSSGSIVNSFSSTVIKDSSSNGRGFIAYPTSPGLVTASFWDIPVSGKSLSYSTAVGTSTSVLKNETYLTSQGWNFSGIWEIDSDKNNGYPFSQNVDPGDDEIIEIDSISDLQNIKDAPGKRYLQTANIDASTTTSWNTGAGFEPIPIFYGKYDGNDYVVTGLFINRSTTDYIALFGDNRGSVENTKLVDINISGQRYVGSLAGTNSGSIYRCGVYEVDSINNINGYRDVGGLVGNNSEYGLITQSFVISDLYASYSNSANYAGGFVGDNAGLISECYARGIVDGAGTLRLGGFAGYHRNLVSASIIDSYASVVVKGGSNAKGFVAYPSSGSTGSVVDSFWDFNISGQVSSYSTVIGTTTISLQSQSNLENIGWDFTNSWAISSSKNNNYPYLQNIDPGSDEIIEVTSVTDLQNIKDNPGARFIQTADIDASATSGWNSGAGFEPIPFFYGQYNGNDKKITGMFISRTSTDSVGIFGENRGIIKRTKVGDGYFSGNNYTGSLVGKNWGYINNSGAYLENNLNQIIGYNDVGGLVGYNEDYGQISKSYALADIYVTYNSASANGGGLVGQNDGVISNCYARGSIDSTYSSADVAGLIGYHTPGSNLSNSYAAVVIENNNIYCGLIAEPTSPGEVNNSFWDIEVSGQNYSRDGIGTTTEAMKTQSTYTDVGWDFSSIWFMNGTDNEGYPFLDPIYDYAMQSTSWKIRQDSINFYGGYGASDSYVMEDTGGEIGTGWSTSSSYTMHAGYQQNDEEMYISLTMSTSTVLSPSVNGLSGGMATGSNEIIVRTNVSAGYTLEIKASTSPALYRIGSSEGFSDYTTSSTDPDFAWQVDSNTSEFGFSIEGVDVVQRYLNNGSDTCNQSGGVSTANTCWDNFSTSNKTLSQSSLGNRDGKTTNLYLRAESGSQNVQPSGVYQAELTVTVYAN